MTFWLTTFWLSSPKKRMLVGRTVLTPDGVGSVRDSTSVSEIPVTTRNRSVDPCIG